jgi:hypothetical protein
MVCTIGATPGTVRGTDRCKRLLADLDKTKRDGLVARERQDNLGAEVERIENTIRSAIPDCVRLVKEIDEVEDALRRMGPYHDLKIE